LRRLLPFLFVWLLAPCLHAAPIDDVRASFLAYTTAAGADRNAPRMREALSALESEARRVSAPGYLLGDGSWNDINYSDTPAGDWSPWNHVRRLAVMAKAYRTPGQALYNDPALRAAIESALGYVPRFYGYWTIPTGNWWFWTIGIPLDLGPTLVLMRGDVSAAVYDDCVRAMAIKIGGSPASKGLVGPTPVGENLTWSCFTHLSLALLKDDAVMLAAVRDAMTTACTPTDGDGIQADNSFHQHGAQLYNGATALPSRPTWPATSCSRAAPSSRCRKPRWRRSPATWPTASPGRCSAVSSTSRSSAATWRVRRRAATTAWPR
jgi:hypothetical protein